MKRASYKSIDDPNPIYGEIPELPGVWANGATREECEKELSEVIEGWVLLGAKFGHVIPILDGIDFNSGEGKQAMDAILTLPENSRLGTIEEGWDKELKEVQ